MQNKYERINELLTEGKLIKFNQEKYRKFTLENIDSELFELAMENERAGRIKDKNLFLK